VFKIYDVRLVCILEFNGFNSNILNENKKIT